MKPINVHVRLFISETACTGFAIAEIKEAIGDKDRLWKIVLTYLSFPSYAANCAQVVKGKPLATIQGKGEAASMANRDYYDAWRFSSRAFHIESSKLDVITSDWRQKRLVFC